MGEGMLLILNIIGVMNLKKSKDDQRKKEFKKRLRNITLT